MEDLYKKARLHKIVMIITEKSAVVLIFISIIIVALYFLVSDGSVVKIIGNAGDKKDEIEAQKRFMIHPRLEIEDKDSFYNLKADRGYYEGSDKIVFENAVVDSNLGKLKAKEVIVENNFNDITVRDNPELVIYPESLN